MKYSKNFYQIRSNEVIFEKLQKERESIGYYTLPFADSKPISEYAKSIDKQHIVVIGIGGSSLGSNAIYEFLRRKQAFSKTLLFLESTDPIDIRSKLESIELGETLFVTISKSGTTVETIGILKYLSGIIKLTADNMVVLSESATPLHAYAQREAYMFFEIPQDIHQCRRA